MPEDAPFPRRHSIRFKSFDYSQPGTYLVTICARDRKCVFGKIILGKAILSPLGEIVNRCWVEIPDHFPGAELPICAVMPNHLHGILVLGERARHAVPLRTAPNSSSPVSEAEAFSAPVSRSIPTIVRSFKSAVTKQARDILGHPDLLVWQRGYYEHVIRDRRDFSNAWDYVRWNPQRWEFDRENLRQKSPLPLA